MKTAEIRKAFLEFFRSKGHEIVKSSSLIPKNDPSLYFTTAGMVQFKDVFLGTEVRSYKRAASAQKCMRAGGKHSDLENVGHTARHHTFFEMLGNFSFGDYFKKDAILFAWELFIEWFKLPPDKLWISVFEKDDEAEQLWQELTGVPAHRIVRFGEKDNFWRMGDTGPCGPCSEILIDQGPEAGCGKAECKIGCDCDRFLELWNLVFMQYNREETGNLTPLPKPSIDTGMGLERISAILQGKKSNFEIDVFAPIISSIESLAKVKFKSNPHIDISIRVIADHIRSITFLLCEGLMPSNEGRGYVLRRIIRRASRHAKLLGLEGAVLYKLIDSVVEAMGGAYPEIAHEKERVTKLLAFEEEKFTRTLEQGVRIIEEIVEKLRKKGEKVIPGYELFKLYDTFGFPLDLARDIAHDNHMQIDEEGFHKEMEIQRERARTTWVGEEAAVASIYKDLQAEIGPTIFVGYDTLKSYSTVKAILKDGKVILEAHKGDKVEIFLDLTPFYGESGGQVGDIGYMENNNTLIEVIDTKKEVDLHSHICIIKEGSLKVWDKLHCQVDSESRLSTARHHTATHLLHTALREVAGDHVKQAGSLVSPDRLRFDFAHFHSLTKSEIREIEDIVNDKILKNIPVKTEITDIQEALKLGATALFGEKYGEKVRVVQVPGVSLELCGGTHCKATGDIGIFVIASESSIASGIRRIEALAGTSAINYLRKISDDFYAISNMLKTDKAIERVEKLLSDLKEKDKEIETLKSKLASDLASSILHNAKNIKGVNVISYIVDNFEQKDLRTLADSIRDKLGSGIIVLFSQKNSQISIIAMVTKDLTNKYNAGKILKEVAQIMGGKGGGKPDMAQGGVAKLENSEILHRAVNTVYDLI
ncbi:MAG: alanine--tRNA ligase [Thermodesulfovibrionales bacterium]|nr:alanine--tRNA ligase [Thermodesulfovibrionales bacterium]